jgi:hypothetical protein
VSDEIITMEGRSPYVGDRTYHISCFVWVHIHLGTLSPAARDMEPDDIVSQWNGSYPDDIIDTRFAQDDHSERCEACSEWI